MAALLPVVPSERELRTPPDPASMKGAASTFALLARGRLLRFVQTDRAARAEKVLSRAKQKR
jgi:hypothetical protein